MKKILNQEDIRRTLKRISHEILERNNGAHNLILMPIIAGGYEMSLEIQKNLQDIEGICVPIYDLDITMYRDDITKKHHAPSKKNNINLQDKTIVLVDDVIYTGRSVRAAMDAITDIGRPACIQLAVLIDRGHRELPVRADFIGKNLPTSKEENVQVLINIPDNENCVLITR